MKDNNMLTKLALILITSVSVLLNNFLTYNQLIQFNYREDSITRNQERFEEIKNYLPSQGIFGYVSDVEKKQEGEKQLQDNSLIDYYIAQYALSPLIIDYNLKHDYLVGNFLTEANRGAILQKLKKDFNFVSDFGNGVMLFKRKNL